MRRVCHRCGPGRGSPGLPPAVPRAAADASVRRRLCPRRRGRNMPQTPLQEGKRWIFRPAYRTRLLQVTDFLTFYHADCQVLKGANIAPTSPQHRPNIASSSPPAVGQARVAGRWVRGGRMAPPGNIREWPPAALSIAGETTVRGPPRDGADGHAGTPLSMRALCVFSN